MSDIAPLSIPVVVRSPNWLGDAIMAFPAVRNLKRLLGDAPFAVAVPEKIAAVWKLCPFVDQVLPLPTPKRLLATAAALRPHRFQTALLLPHSWRSAAEARLASIPNVIGYPGHYRRWHLSRVITPPPFSFARQHQQYLWIDLMCALGAEPDDSFPALNCPAGEAPTQIGLCPGAEYGPAKRWLVEHFVKVGNHLSARHQLPLTIFGAPVDRPIGDQIATQLPQSRNLTGQTTLPEFIAELSRCKIVLCNDSGAMHLASALRVPTVAVFGSTEPRRTGPLGPHASVLRHHVPCSPCFLRECPLDFSCMKQVTPDLTLAASDQLLNLPLSR